MNIVKSHNLACPIDGEPLEYHGRQLVCEHGHAFDIARQGYVNLLPVQHKRTKHPGDSKAMVLARTHFLNSGVYEAIASQLNKLVYTQITAGKETVLLDAGCGEGYYFNALLNYLSDKEAATDLSFVGLDISKDAIYQASKRNRQISWLVGTNRRPPVTDESIDIILCLFGFLSVPGFKKVLKPGGKIIIVDPGPEHLKELKEIIYPEVKKSYPLRSLQTEKTDLSLVNSEGLQFKVSLNNNEQINNLLMMTPHFYRASKAGREVACNLHQLTVTVDVVFSVLQKT